MRTSEDCPEDVTDVWRSQSLRMHSSIAVLPFCHFVFMHGMLGVSIQEWSTAPRELCGLGNAAVKNKSLFFFTLYFFFPSGSFCASWEKKKKFSPRKLGKQQKKPRWRQPRDGGNNDVTRLQRSSFGQPPHVVQRVAERCQRCLQLVGRGCRSLQGRNGFTLRLRVFLFTQSHADSASNPFLKTRISLVYKKVINY